jgi:RadC-like JAB domain
MLYPQRYPQDDRMAMDGLVLLRPLVPYGEWSTQAAFGLGWIAIATFAHNHPSGVAQPSHADELLTRNLKDALSLVEVKVLDHFVVAGNQAVSFAERGLL